MFSNFSIIILAKVISQHSTQFQDKDNRTQNKAVLVTRDVVSVSDVSSRDGLETYQRLVSVSSRANWQTSRSRLGLEVEHLGLGLGLGY